MANILIVDDEEHIRDLTTEILEMNGYKCKQAADASEARVRLKEDNFELILSDIKMPGESGLDFIQHALAEYPETAAIMVTATDDPVIADVALKIGVYDFITKPFELNEVLVSVANALRRRQLEIDNREYSKSLENMVAERTNELQESVGRLQKALEGSIQAMALTVEMRDPYTAGHQHRVSNLAHAIALEMGVEEDQIQGIRMGGLTHDLGKIAIPAEILSKPGRISTTEFQLIKSHAEVGYEILKNIEFPWPIAQMALQHHERINGSGYPSGLPGSEIIFEAKVLAIADVVEAMASHRPYRPALGIDLALEEINKHRGEIFDSDIADACFELFKERGYELG